MDAKFSLTESLCLSLLEDKLLAYPLKCANFASRGQFKTASFSLSG